MIYLRNHQVMNVMKGLCQHLLQVTFLLKIVLVLQSTMVLIVLNTATTTRPDPASSVRSEHKAQQEDEFVNFLYST